MKPLPHPPRPTGKRWSHLAIALAVGLAGLTAQAASDPKAAKLYEDALQRFEKKDHAGAVVQLKSALQIDKNMLPVHVLLGKVLLAQGQPVPAEAALLEALRLGVSREEVVLPLARANLDMGRPRVVLDDDRYADKDLSASTRFALLVLKAGAADDAGDRKLALQLLEKARALDATSADTWIAEAKLRLGAAQLPEAAAATDKALALAPSAAPALYGKASLAHTRGDLKGALAAYDKLLQAHPDHADGLVARAGLLLDLNRAADAARDVAALLKVDPKDARGFYLSAQLAQREGRIADAKASLAQVTSLLDPIPIDMLRYRTQLLMLGGLSHFDLDETEKAKPYLEGVLRNQPGSPAAKLMARIHIKENNHERAIEVLDGYLRLHSRDAQATLLLASAHMAQGRHPRAIAILQSALEQGRRPELEDALGMAYMKAGRFKQALALLEDAYKRQPGATPIGTSLAALYLQLGQPAKALKVAEQLNKDRKDQPGLQFLLGRARLEAGDLKGARVALESAAKADARFLDPQLELAKIDLRSGALAAAESRLSAAVQRDPKHPDLLSLLGQTLAGMKRYDEAQRWLEKADDHSAPDVIDHGMRLVGFHLALGQIDRAREAMKRVTAKAPEAPRALLMQARIELAAGDVKVAKSLLSRASTAASTDAAMLVAIAEMQLTADDAAGAAHSAGKALKEEPQDIGAQVVLARTDILLGNLPAAEQRARELTTRLPKAGLGHSLLGAVSMARKQDAAATSAFRRAFELDNNRQTLLQLFNHLARTQATEAPRVAEQWLKKHPDDAVIWRSLADSQARAADWAGARRSYESVLKLRADDAEALNNLAHVLLALKDPGALKIAERALALQPTSAHIIGTMGWVAHKAGQNDRALQHLRDARLRSPDSAETRYYLGATLAAMGRTSEARTELTAAVQSSRAFVGRKDAEALLASLK